MMNILALSLVLSSLAAAGVWSPTPQREDVIVKDGHRVIVIEYDEDGKYNTKVSISPPPQPQHETIREGGAASVLPNLGHGISQEGKDGPGRHSPGELICDAFGRCTNSIATAFGKAKDKVSETAHEAKEKVSETKDRVAETARQTKGVAGDFIGKAKEAVAAHEAKDKVSEIAHEAKDKVSETKDRVAETARQTKGVVRDVIGKAKEAVAPKGQDGKENAKGFISKAKDTVNDTANTIEDHIVSNATEELEKTERAANKFFNWLKHLVPIPALNSMFGIANLLGLATAYGMSVWVTFISSYVLAGVLPRQQFGVVQSKVYPVYFRAMAYSIGLALLGHVLGHRKTLFSSKPHMFQAFNLLLSHVMVLANALYLEPKATNVMFERMKMEKEEGRGRDDFFAEGSKASEPPIVTNIAAATKSSEPPSVTNIVATTKTRDAPSPAAMASEQEAVVRSRITNLNERLKKLNANSSLLNVLTLMALTWHLVYLGQHLTISC